MKCDAAAQSPDLPSFSMSRTAGLKDGLFDRQTPSPVESADAMKKSTTVRKALWLSLCMVFAYYIFYGMPRVASNVRETSGQCGPPAQKQGADIALGPEDVWDEVRCTSRASFILTTALRR